MATLSSYSLCFSESPVAALPDSRSFPSKLGTPRRHLQPSVFFGSKLAVSHSKRSRSVTKHCCGATTATVLLSLPSKKTSGASSDVPLKWSARAIKSFAMAELEARKLKYPITGTESLLMGILVEGTNLAAKTLRSIGVTLSKVREETLNLLGKSDMYYCSPEHPPLSELAKRAIDWAVEEKLKSGEDGEITTIHLLLGIWSEKESAGHRILATLGFTDENAKELAKSMDKDIVFSFKQRSQRAGE